MIGDSLQPLVVKNDTKASLDGFGNHLLRSFLHTLYQAIGSSSRDVRCFVWAGRLLWTKYIEPLHKDRVDDTVRLVQSRIKAGQTRELDNKAVGEDVLLEKEILLYLDEQILTHSKIINLLAFPVPVETSRPNSTTMTIAGQTQDRHGDMPYLSKCMLLAGFICQHNKPATDKELFSIEKNAQRGKRRRQSVRRGHDEDGDEEAAAYADTTFHQERLQILRPKSFVLERMLSVFVSIVGQNGSSEQNLVLDASLGFVPSSLPSSSPFSVGNDGLMEWIRSLGSPVFFESIAALRDMGLFREVEGTCRISDDYRLEAISMNNTKYCCDLSKEDATAVANSIGFELAQYLRGW